MAADLRSVERAARKAALSHQALEQAIREARAEGLPLRTIAQAAGMSHEKVRQVSASR